MRSFLRKVVLMVAAVLVIGGAGALYGYWRIRGGDSESNIYIGRWLRNPDALSDWRVDALTQCPEAPFIFPTGGFPGLLYRDSAGPYSLLSRHTGVDIFGGEESGKVPIYAVYDGYLTRPADWRSTVIIRHDDPLQPGRTIWTYYTHMARRDGGAAYIADDFPPGTFEHFVEQGTLLGYQGEYNPGFGIATHLHFSMVKTNPDGSYMNEAILENTIDPSPYFGMPLNLDAAPSIPITCGKTPGHP